MQFFPKVRILEISIKTFQISGSVSGSRLKAVFGNPYPVANPFFLPDIQPAIRIVIISGGQQVDRINRLIAECHLVNCT